VEHNVEKTQHRTVDLVQGTGVVHLVEGCIHPLEDQVKGTKEAAKHSHNYSQGMEEARHRLVHSRLLALPYCLDRHQKECQMGDAKLVRW